MPDSYKLKIAQYRPSGRWQAQILLPDGTRITHTGPSRQAVADWADRVMAKRTRPGRDLLPVALYLDFAQRTGLRRAQLAGLRWGDIDPITSAMRVCRRPTDPEQER